MSEHETSNLLSVTEKEISGTTYIVKACCSPDATETLYEKIRRLILEDARSMSHS